MKWTGLNELREKFLEFFESKGCLRLPSFSLVPKDDNSLLLINSGMAPMKKYFTGEVTPPRKRVTTCQKCIRFDIWFWDLPTMVESSFSSGKKSSRFTSPIIVVSRKFIFLCDLSV